MKQAIEMSELLEVPGLLDNDVSKNFFKRTVKTVLRKRNNSEIKSDIEKYKKMEILRKEEKKKNDYIKEEYIPNARVLFRRRCDMFDSKMNFKHNIEYKKDNYLCDSCETEQDDNLHVLHSERLQGT